jgi:hypothetical protein
VGRDAGREGEPVASYRHVRIFLVSLARAAASHLIGGSDMKTGGAFLANSLLALGMVGATSVSAGAYILNTNNIGYTSGLNDFVYVTITAVGDDIQFTVDANESLFDTTGLTNFGIQGFGFNSSHALNAANIQFPAVGYDMWDVMIAPGDNTMLNGFGLFDIEVADTGQQRHDPLMFSIVGIAGDTVMDYAMASTAEGRTDRWFAAHVTDFHSGITAYRDSIEGNACDPDNWSGPGTCDPVELTSAYFSHTGGSPPENIVPEPLSAALVGTAVLGLVTIRRKIT